MGALYHAHRARRTRLRPGLGVATKCLMRFVLGCLCVVSLLACGTTPNPGACSQTNCQGCCDTAGACQVGSQQNFCGQAGSTCRACSAAESCILNVCSANGGTGGGNVAGGGGAAGGGSGTGGGAGTVDAGLTPEQQSILAARPYTLVVPSGYDGGVAPLLVLLHGYGATGAIQNNYFGFTALANARTFLLATPDGTLDSNGKRFWNATNACCNFAPPIVDDVKYLSAIIDDAALRYRVDPRRVFVVGHSNGGFMAHRMACDRADRVAAIVSLAGANWKDLSSCQPSQPVAVLQVHGTMDQTIAYDGGTLGPYAFPGARETVQGWATKNGCSGTLTSIPGPLDLDTAVVGSETSRASYTCATGAAELWTLEGSGHVPNLNANWRNEVWNFLAAHAKP